MYFFILAYFSVQMYRPSEIEMHLLENRRWYVLFSEKYIQIKQVSAYNKKRISASVVRFMFELLHTFLYGIYINTNFPDLNINF